MIKDMTEHIEDEYVPDKKRPHLSMEQRAAQFSPFAALTGLEEKMEETRINAEKKVLSENK